MTQTKSNVVSMRRRSSFATAADTFDVDALLRDLDGQGANSTSYAQGILGSGEAVTFNGGRRGSRHAA
ncbi:hypothetical protein [Sphingomonas sp. 3-13AW]|uniref:hypothetical protein n=1 Tax=Sphingomonas sp. 3-13AW TaxID=3050450 RepID=UPI003BB76FB8